MCSFHWPLVDADVRRRLVAAVSELRLNHGRKPTELLLELFTEAIQQAQYREGAARAQEALKARAEVDPGAPDPVVLRGAFPPTH